MFVAAVGCSSASNTPALDSHILPDAPEPPDVQSSPIDVPLPTPDGGCTLADGITAADVQRLRKEYSEYTFVCYINTTAAVKALCDVCVTSSNVYAIVERIENDRIYFLPDRLMGENVINHLRDKGVEKTIEVYDGTCYVHEEYTPQMITNIRRKFDGVSILAHPECDETIIEKSDYVGSTSQMVNYVKEKEK